MDSGELRPEDRKVLLGLVHDLQNALTVTCGSEGLARDILSEGIRDRGCPACKEARDYLENSNLSTAISHAARIQAVIHERVHRDLRRVHIAERIKHLETEVKPHVKQTLGIDLEVVGSVSVDCQVYSHPETAQRVTENIILNAHRACATSMWLEYTEHEFTVSVRFTDNGSGMSQDQLDKLGFGFSDHAGGEGVAIVRDLIHEAGGVVVWRSMPHLGTECIITLRKVRD